MKYYLIVFIILFLQKISPLSASEINSIERDITTTSSRAVVQDNQPIYSMRYLKSDVIYGTCIIGGCIIGGILTSLPQLEAAFSLFGELGAMNIFNFYVKPMAIGALVGGSIGCCAGAALKANTIRRIPFCTNTPVPVQSPESNV